MSETTSEATTLEIWYSPSGGEMRVGPGDPPRDERTPYPWDVLRFRGGFLTISTADAHYPDWRKWLTMTAPAYPGLRVVSEAEVDAIKALATMSDAEFESARFLRTGRKNG